MDERMAIALKSVIMGGAVIFLTPFIGGILEKFTPIAFEIGPITFADLIAASVIAWGASYLVDMVE